MGVTTIYAQPSFRKDIGGGKLFGTLSHHVGQPQFKLKQYFKAFKNKELTLDALIIQVQIQKEAPSLPVIEMEMEYRGRI